MLICQANTLIETGGSSETAQRCYLKALELDESPLVWRNLGRLYVNHELWEDAETCFRNAGAQLWLAQIYERLSRYDEAWTAVNAAPKNAAQAALLGRIARFMGYYQAGIDALRPHRSTACLFELAKLYDKQGEYGRAWSTAEQANESVGERCPEPFPDLVYTIPREHHSAQPIFIVGMPRSGTTLMERMLAQHPEIESKGESEFFNIVVDNLLQDRKVRDIAAGYLLNHKRRTVDKAPMNLRHIDLIRGTFPDARFILMRRDPDDVAISCYMRKFNGNQPWAYHWDDIHAAIERCEDLAAGHDLFEVRYEDLVSKPREVLERVLDHCRLDWNASCLRHDADRTNHVGSYEETRKPIFTESVGRAQNYRPFMPRSKRGRQANDKLRVASGD